MSDLSYREKREKLDIRIRAHKQFANIDVGDWIDGFLARRKRHAIFDLGCGNGNHFPLYLRHVGSSGMLVGLDREASLVEDARRKHAGAANVEVRVGSMDEPLPFPDGTFDTCFSNFAIYNATSPKQTLLELHRVVKVGGEIILIGPTRNNARELYEFNERLTGEAIDPVTLVRTDRLRQEILPIVREVFSDVSEEVINSHLVFPTGEAFLEYYTATMLYEEGAEKLGKTKSEMRAALASEYENTVSKEMLALVATR